MPAKIEHPPEGSVYSPFLYNATTPQLEKFLMLGVCVAGKVARIQQEKLDEFLLQMRNYLVAHREPSANWPPFEQLYCVINQPGGVLARLLRNAKLGKYTLLLKSFRHMAYSPTAAPPLDLRTCTREELTKVPGVGIKTASFFILFTRPGERIGCMDTHLLQFLKENNLAEDVPKVPRNEKDYLRLEQAFLKYCDEKHPNETVAEVDFNIWLARNVGDKHAKKES